MTYLVAQQYLVNIVVLGSIYALFALGLTLAWGVANVLNLAQGATFVFAAFVAYVAASIFPLPIYVLLPLAMETGGGVTLALELFILHPIRDCAQPSTDIEEATLIATLGVGAVLTNIVANVTHYQIARIDPK